MSIRYSKGADLERNERKALNYARMYGKNVSLEEMKAYYRTEIAKKRQSGVKTPINPYLGPKNDDSDSELAKQRVLKRYESYNAVPRPTPDPNTAFKAKHRQENLNEIKRLTEEELPSEEDSMYLFWDE